MVLWLNMIRTSIIVLFPGLRYAGERLGLGAQTIRPGQLGPASHLLSGVILTGYFLVLSEIQYSAPEGIGPTRNQIGSLISVS